MTKWLLLAGAIVSEAAATIALRAAVDHSAWLAVVVVGYLTAFTLLGLTLRVGMPIGIAYGIWGATGVVLTAVLGLVIFSESLSPGAVAGIALIVVGVVVVETGAPTLGYPESESTVPAAAAPASTGGRAS